ncbi:MAG: TVP38/TMEM64 family protein [Dehalococcoidia bacterium]
MREVAARGSLVVAVAVGVGVFLLCDRVLGSRLLGVVEALVLGSFVKQELDEWAMGGRRRQEGRPWLADPVLRRRILTVMWAVGGLAWFGLGEAASGIDADDARQWIRDLGPWGPLLVIGCLALAMVIAPIPNVPFMIAAGLAWGTVVGTGYALIGQFLGATTVFFLSRRFGRRFLPRMVGESAAARIDRLSENMGATLVFWGRIVPLVSFDWTSYAAGLTSMRYRRFIVAAMGGSLIPTTVAVYFGESLTSSWSARVISITLIVLAITIPTGIWLVRNRASLPRRGEWGKALEGLSGAPGGVEGTGEAVRTTEAR